MASAWLKAKDEDEALVEVPLRQRHIGVGVAGVVAEAIEQGREAVGILAAGGGGGQEGKKKQEESHDRRGNGEGGGRAEAPEDLRAASLG